MRLLSEIRERLRALLFRSREEREMEEEIRFHLAMETDRLMREEGLAPGEARRRARVAFGGVDRFKEEVRDARGTRWLENLAQDARYALRGLRKSPGFTAAALLTLALGIGATTAVFSVVSSVLLAPLPYAQPDRVVTVWNAFPEHERASLSGPELLDYRRELNTFEELAAYRRTELNLTDQDYPERLPAQRVTANVFDALGVSAAVGRTFVPEEDVPGRDDVVLLGHGLWERRFAGDPSVVGRPVRLHGRLRTVVGVMPPDFRLPQDFEAERPAELWVPLALDPEDPGQRGRHTLRAVGRLRDGATVEQANADLDGVTRRWVEEGVTDIEGFTAFAVPVKEEVVGDVRPALLVLFGAVGFVLLIACANVANLLLVRNDGRRHEIALRLALGAARRRIVSQFLTESVLLALAGGLAGAVLALGAVEVLVAIGPEGVPRLDEVVLDGRVLAFTTAVAVLSGLLFGAVPAARAAGGSLLTPLEQGGRGASGGRGRQRFRGALVVAEVALSVVLVVGAGLMIRSFVELQRLELGMEPEKVLTLRLSLSSADYPATADLVGFYRELTGRVEALPGVHSAGAAALLPLSDPVGDWGIDIQDRPEPPGESFAGHLQIVTPGYFETLGIPLVRGRLLTGADREDAAPAMVVSESMAERYWPGESALGRRIRLSGQRETWFTVVGVVGDIRHNAVEDDPLPILYFPHAQLSMALGGTTAAMAVIIRTDSEPLSALGPVRDIVHSMDPNLPVARVRLMERIVDSAVAERRFTTLLLTVFAAAALALGAVGIYGVISYAVSRRTREIGIRTALGAPAGALAGMVVRQAMILVGTGIALGLAGALATTSLLGSLLFAVSPTDPLTIAAVAALLLAVSLLASWLPARRAARVDAMVALRSE